MSSTAVLNIFQEYRPITFCWGGEGAEKFYLYGVARLTELPYMKLQFPQSSFYDVNNVKQESQVKVYFEIDYSYLMLHTRVVKHIHQRALLVRIEHHEQSKQKRAVSRAPASRVCADYLPVDKQGTPLRDKKKQGEAVNISKTGILLRTDEIFEPNQRLEMNLTLPEVRLVHCFGQVVRLALHRTGVIESAIQFENMTHANRTWLGNYVTKISE